MTTDLIKTLVVIVAWAAFLQRGYIAFKRRHSSQIKPGIIPLWVVWVPSFFLLLAGTTYNELYLQFISSRFGVWFIYVPRVALGITAFVICAYACVRLHLLPDEHLPTWRKWPIVAGILAVVNFALLNWIGWHLFPDRLLSFERTADMVFRGYLLVTTIRVTLPTIQQCRLREPGVILRMRLSYLWWFNVFFAIWMGIEILTIGKGNALLSTPFVVGFWITFILGLFTSDRFYERRLVYLYQINTFLAVRFVELLTHMDMERAAWRQPRRVDWRALIYSPEKATYKSVISILDNVKLLNNEPEDSLAGGLGRRINVVRNPASGYLEVANVLREIGFEYLTSVRILCTLLYRLFCRLRSSWQESSQYQSINS